MPLKILLADDNMTAQNTGRKILAEAGYTVIAVSNGAAALKKFGAEKPDLLVLDVFMPGYSGLEVCEKVKAESAVPVLLTASAMEPFRASDGERVRADGVVNKPFDASELLKHVGRFAAPTKPVPPPPPPPKPQGATSFEATGAVADDVPEQSQEREPEPVDAAALHETGPQGPSIPFVDLSAPNSTEEVHVEFAPLSTASWSEAEEINSSAAEPEPVVTFGKRSAFQASAVEFPVHNVAEAVVGPVQVAAEAPAVAAIEITETHSGLPELSAEQPTGVVANSQPISSLDQVDHELPVGVAVAEQEAVIPSAETMPSIESAPDSDVSVALEPRSTPPEDQLGSIASWWIAEPEAEETPASQTHVPDLSVPEAPSEVSAEPFEAQQPPFDVLSQLLPSAEQAEMVEILALDEATSAQNESSTESPTPVVLTAESDAVSGAEISEAVDRALSRLREQLIAEITREFTLR